MPRRRTKNVRSIVLLALGGVMLVMVVGLALRPASTPDYRAQANGAQRSGQLSQALVLYTRALEELDSDLRGRERVQLRAALLAERGQCNLEMGRTENALQDLRESRGLLPDEGQRWLREGEAYLEMRRFDDAARLYEEASLAFPDRERFFRYASGAANYSKSRALLAEALISLKKTMSEFQRDEIEDAAWAFVAGARTLDSFLEEFLPGPQDTPSRQSAMALLRQARKVFVKADTQFEDYDSWSRIEPASALVRAQMDYAAGRLYRMKRLLQLMLNMRPPLEFEIQMKELLANSEYELENFDEAAKTFLSMRRLYTQKRDHGSARRAAHFAVECYLRAGDGEAGLDLLDAGRINASENPFDLFMLGRARFLAGREDYIPPIVRSVEILRADKFTPSSWARLRRNRDRILLEMIECLRAGDRDALALEVASVGTFIYPDRADFHRLRLNILRDLGGRPAAEGEMAYQILRLGARRSYDFDVWLAAQRALWPSESALAKLVATETRRVVQEFSRPNLPPGKGGNAEPAMSDELATLLGMKKDTNTKPDKPTRNQRALAATRRYQGSTLLGDLKDKPFVAYQVYEQLVREGQRNRAYLLLLGLADHQSEVPQFRFLLAEHDMIDGRLLQANEGLEKVLDSDPRDVESALSLWRNYHTLGQREDCNRIEAKMLRTDPEGAGRLLACLSALENGFPDITVKIGEGTQNNSYVYASVIGLVAQAKHRQGRLKEALGLADQALKAQPNNPFATVALLLVYDAQRATGGDKLAAKHLSRHAAALATLPIAELAHAGRTLYRNGAFEMAGELLRLVLDRNTNHIPARRDLIDSLIGEDALEEAENQLNQLDRIAGRPDLMRHGLLIFLRSGPEKAYLSLRGQVVPSADYQRHKLWVSLLGASAKRLASSIRNLTAESQISEDAARFLAMHWILTDLQLPAEVVPPQVLEKYKGLVGAPEGEAPPPRDRELERWVSLEVTDGGPSFSRSMLAVLLLRDHEPFAPLLSKHKNVLLTRFPSLGPLARESAVRQYQARRMDRAVRTLLDQVSRDPADRESLELLAMWSGQLNVEQVDRLLEHVKADGEDQGIALLLQGLRQSVNNPAEGLQTLAQAAEALSVPGPALVASLRIQERESAWFKARPALRSPYSELGDMNRAIDASDQFETFLGRLLTDHPEDGSLQAYLVDFLGNRENPANASPTLMLRLMDRLLLTPTDNWKAFRIMAEVLVSQSPDKIPIERLGVALRTSLDEFPDSPRTIDTVHALAMVARGLREHEMLESADALLNVAEDICQYDAKLIEERARLVEVQGDPLAAIQLRKMAVVCGSTDPEITLRMAKWALDVDFDLEHADMLAVRSLELLKKRGDPQLTAAALRIRGKVAYIYGDYATSRRSRTQASQLLGEDELLDVDLALEGVSTGSYGQVKDAVQALARADTPYQDLMRKLGSLVRTHQTSASN